MDQHPIGGQGPGGSGNTHSCYRNWVEFWSWSPPVARVPFEPQ